MRLMDFWATLIQFLYGEHEKDEMLMKFLKFWDSGNILLPEIENNGCCQFCEIMDFECHTLCALKS